ncbi:hypothetical protein RO575_08260 [Methylomonas sp. MO1]|nr:hypothetical protein [Methylomonas sp. MO1]MDT4289549.1 hypothetical protein [Methylomonas sp. MO1]
MSINSYGGRNSAGQGAALRLNITPQPKAERVHNCTHLHTQVHDI